MIAGTVGVSTGRTGNDARRRPLPTGAALTNPLGPSTTNRRKDVQPVKHTPVSSRAETLPCRTADPELWFSERPADVADAKARCQACPIMAACLDGATRRREPYGVWGGELFLAGTPTQRGYRRDRPEGRTCGHCGDPIPDRLRADAEVCSKSCREARARARIAARRAAGEAA